MLEHITEAVDIFISDLPPTTVYALAAPSASAVREQLIAKVQPGERLEAAVVQEMLRKPRTTKKPAKEESRRAAIEAHRPEDPKHLPLDERWDGSTGDPEEAAELVVELLKERFGDEFPRLIKIMQRAGWQWMREKLAIDMFPRVNHTPKDAPETS